MRAVHFEGANMTFNKPVSMDDSECLPVSAFIGQDENGNAYINVVYMPNREDIEAILAGRGIVVSVLGTFLPPMSLFTCDENDLPNF